jgi:diaminopimelate epimerase
MTFIAHQIPFRKMQALGNDFVILDGREQTIDFLDIDWRRKIANRNLGVGCDQLIVLRPSDNADLKMVIYNQDGSEAGACGNATRCVAKIIAEESQFRKDHTTIETQAGILTAYPVAQDHYQIDMGLSFLDPKDIPVVSPKNEKNFVNIDFQEKNLPMAVAVGMGNPHCVFFREDWSGFDLEECGSFIENHPLFPMRTNVEFCRVIGDHHIDMTVWERGAGFTLACGSGACAVAVASILRGFCRHDETILVSMKGGDLRLVWRSHDQHVLMTGEANHVFTGFLPANF